MTDGTRAGVRLAAVAAPALVAAVAGAARAYLASTGAVLVLVLVVVAVTLSGDRIAGLLAALSSAASFDFFLAAPVHSFAITSRDDVETAVGLLAIAVAVSEIVRWGRRQVRLAGRRSDHLRGVARVARLAAESSPASELADLVADMIKNLLDLDDCRFDPGTATTTGRPVLDRDGTVRWAGRVVDVSREGLPAMDVIELPAGRGDGVGRFLLTASTELRRPTTEELLVAVTLAEQLVDATSRPTPT